MFGCCSKNHKKKRAQGAPNQIFLTKTKQKGLKNLGNTCYINSVLHCLFSIKAFKNIIEGTMASDKSPVLYSLKKLLYSLDKRKSHKYYKGFISCIKKVHFGICDWLNASIVFSNFI